MIEAWPDFLLLMVQFGRTEYIEERIVKTNLEDSQLIHTAKNAKARSGENKDVVEQRN